MSLSHGANVEALEASAGQLEHHGAHLRALADRGQHAVRTLAGEWLGADAADFERSWWATRAGLDATATSLDDLIGTLRHDIAEQRGASEETAGHSTGSGGIRTMMPAPAPLPTPPLPTPTDIPLDETTTEDGPRIEAVPGRERFGMDDWRHPAWTPQGLAYDEDRNLLVSTMYDTESEGGTAGLLVLQDKDTGDTLTKVELAGIDHYGGVAVDGDNVWVSGDGQVQLYSMQEILAAEEGSEVDPARTFDVAASSTVTYADGHIFVADFTEKEDDPGRIYSYEVAPDGTVAAEPDGEWTAPSGQIQGIAVDDDHIYLSQSYGRENESQLTRMPRGTDSTAGAESVTMPNMSEGITIVGDDLYTTYESGADEYAGSGEPRERMTITHLH